MTTFEQVADDLYGASPEGFVSARDAAARAARADGDRELAGRIADLRKPTVAAWLVNLLVRDDPDLAGQLVALGDGLREAERTLDGVGLRDLSRQRRALVSSLVARARALARDEGHRAGDAALQEVDSTLTAALADADVARAVASGRLTAGQQYVGFGAADASMAGPVRHASGPRAEAPEAPASPPVRLVDRPAAPGRSAPDPAAQRRDRAAEKVQRAADERRRAADKAWRDANAVLERAQDDADTATAQRDERRSDLDAAEQAAQDARDLLEELTDALADVRRRLARAQKDAGLAEKRVTRTETALHDDERSVVAAQHALRRAQRELDQAEQARQTGADE